MRVTTSAADEALAEEMRARLRENSAPVYAGASDGARCGAGGARNVSHLGNRSGALPAVFGSAFATRGAGQEDFIECQTWWTPEILARSRRVGLTESTIARCISPPVTFREGRAERDLRGNREADVASCGPAGAGGCGRRVWESDQRFDAHDGDGSGARYSGGDLCSGECGDGRRSSRRWNILSRRLSDSAKGRDARTRLWRLAGVSESSARFG